MIHPTAIIYPNVVIEDNVYIGPYCVIGAPAESIKYEGKEGKGVHIMKGAKIHGLVSIDSGTEFATLIGDDCFIMKGCHVGHDSILMDRVRLAPRALIGGHVTVGQDVIIGMGAIIHQRKTIPANCVIGMGSVVTRTTELWSDGIFAGNPCTFLKAKDK